MASNCETEAARKMNAKLVEYRQAFSFFDANRDGHITAEELESAMNKCGIHPTKLELRVIMSEGDKDSEYLSGRVCLWW